MTERGAEGRVAGQVVVVSRDAALLEEVHRVAAGAGVVPVVTDEPAAACRWWPEASLLLVGSDLAAPLAELAPPRRSGVLLLTTAAEAQDFRVAVSLGAESVLELPTAADWLAGTLADVADPRAPGLTVAVIGGSGGVGATVLATALAQAASWSGPSVLVDLDPWGPGADFALGLEATGGLRWDSLDAGGRLGGGMLRHALPRSGGLGVLTWGAGRDLPGPAPVRAVLDAARRGHDLVVVDLPRRPCEAVEDALVRCDRVLLVVSPTLGGIAAACAVRDVLGHRPSVVLRGRGVDPVEVAAVVGPVVAEVPEHRGVAESMELGLGPLRGPRGSFARSVLGLLQDLRSGAGAGLLREVGR